ncbi:MAG: selenosugar synthase SenB, partial [Gammaproteobacteria bacterium]|nr:selenosugar synthase SenB [Gammaproteobacteria bacterium]
MRIIMVTPAPPRSRAGNRQTAVRWSRMLQQLGHNVHLDVAYDGSPFDLMIGLHAWRSAEAITQFDASFPDRPLVVALTGTDLYRFIHSHRRTILRSLAAADRLVTLHELAQAAIPARYCDKVRTIYQSAPPLPRRLPPRKRTFDICVVGHLREEKDSLRAAYAVRDVPESSRLRILHYGKPHTERWRRAAYDEMQANPRYRWFGELPHWKVRQAYARSRALVMSSNMEGGANAVSEAIVAGLPVIASEIPGNVGLLGADYPGYYPVRDTRALRRLLL